MKKRWRGVAAASLVLFLIAGCAGGGPDQTTAETQQTLDPFGLWIWTLTDPFGCPTTVEQEFPFLDTDNKQFEVFDEGNGNFGTKFLDNAGNTVEVSGTFDSATGFVDTTFCITERRPDPILAGGSMFICSGKGYVTDEELNSVVAYNMETGQRIGPITGGTCPQPGDMGASPDGQYLAVPCRGNSTVLIVDTTTDTVMQTITATTGNPPGDPAVNLPTSCVFHPALNKLYVHNQSAGNEIGECNYISIFDTSSTPFTLISNDTLFTGCNGAPATGLCISPQAVGNDYLLVALDGAPSQNLYVINATTDQIIEFASALPGNCQCAFTHDAQLLTVVGGNGLSIYETANFFSDTETFESYNIPGWDVAISTDNDRAYITTGNKRGDVVVLSGIETPQVPNIRCFDLNTRTEITPGPSETAPAWGIDTCPNYAFYAAGSSVKSFHIPNHNTFNLGTEIVPRYVRLVPNASTFIPRVIKLRFTANLTFLDDARQLDGITQIVETRNFTFACQTVLSDNTWVFIQDFLE